MDITHVVAFMLGVSVALLLDQLRQRAIRKKVDRILYGKGAAQVPPKMPPAPMSTGDSVGNPWPPGKIKPPYQWPPAPPGRRVVEGVVSPRPSEPKADR